jgi:hypothetical protein
MDFWIVQDLISLFFVFWCLPGCIFIGERGSMRMPMRQQLQIECDGRADAVWLGEVFSMSVHARTTKAAECPG